MPTRPRGRPPKQFSPAQLAAHEASRLRAAAAHAEAPSIEPEAETLATPSEMDDLLSKLGAALMASGQTRAARNQQIADLEKLLTSFQIKDYPELLENPVILQFAEALAERKATTNSDDPPGTIYNGGTFAATKKRWQWRDLASMPVVTFTPMETIPVTYNGIMVVLQADLEMTVPKCFKDIYDEHRRAHESARQHAAVMFRQRDAIGGTADPSILSPASSRVRGHGMGRDGYRPGAGLFPYGAEEEEAEGAKTPAK